MQVPNLVEAVRANYKKQIKNYPCHKNRASSIGDPCMRRLVLDRVAWEHKQKNSVELQMVFEEGNLHEGKILKDLTDAGFQVIEQQVSYVDKSSGITGHIDAVVVHEEKSVPIEIKSCAPHIFMALKGYPQNKYFEAMTDLGKKYHWLKKYPAQIMIYLFAKGVESGIVLFKNKSNGQLKQFTVEIDLIYLDHLFKKSAKINEYVSRIEKNQIEMENGSADKYLPERINEKDLCQSCNFNHICLPDIKFGPDLKINDNPIFEKLIERWVAEKEHNAGYDKLNKELNEMCRGVENVIVGKYHITGKQGKVGWLKNIEQVESS